MWRKTMGWVEGWRRVHRVVAFINPYPFSSSPPPPLHYPQMGQMNHNLGLMPISATPAPMTKAAAAAGASAPGSP